MDLPILHYVRTHKDTYQNYEDESS